MSRPGWCRRPARAHVRYCALGHIFTRATSPIRLREGQCPMNIADRERIKKLVGMLGSSFGGERDNAVRFIQKIAEDNKLSLNEAMALAFDGSAPKQEP